MQGFDKNSDFCQDALNSSAPVVFIDIPLANETSSYIGSDIDQALFSAMDYLHSLNHQEIGFIHGHDKAHITDLWLSAYHKYLKLNNIKFDPKKLLNGEYSTEQTHLKAFNYLKENPKVTAIFCASDTMAIGLIQATNEMAMTIPKDLSILGFDNILLSQYFTPSISSVSQSPYEFGRHAFSLLLRLIQKEELIMPVILATEIIERSSTQPFEASI